MLLQSDEYSHVNFVPQTGTRKQNKSSASIILVPLTVAFRFVHERVSTRLELQIVFSSSRRHAGGLVRICRISQTDLFGGWFMEHGTG